MSRQIGRRLRQVPPPAARRAMPPQRLPFKRVVRGGTRGRRGPVVARTGFQQMSSSLEHFPHPFLPFLFLCLLRLILLLSLFLLKLILFFCFNLKKRGKCGFIFRNACFAAPCVFTPCMSCHSPQYRRFSSAKGRPLSRGASDGENTSKSCHSRFCKYRSHAT